MISRSDRSDIKSRLVALTRDLILIPSIPTRPEDRQRCFEFIKNHLESVPGIEVTTYSIEGIPSLVALPKGIKKPELMMCAHLDVIAHPDVSVYRSVIEDGCIYGPGAGDMKGALAIILEVFRFIHSKKSSASLGVMITADEETGGQFGVGQLINKEGVRCKKAMIPDGGSLNQVTIEEKGILHLSLHCKGKTAHAARPWLGDNPLERMLHRLHQLRISFEQMKTSADHWHPTCSLTNVSTDNQQINRIPHEASAILDVRFPKPNSVKQMMQFIVEVLGGDIEVKTIIAAEPSHLAADQLYQDIICEVTHEPAILCRDDGGSDARYFTAKKIPVLMSRPLVGNLHAVNEWINIESMVAQYQIYEQYILRTV